MHSFPHFNPAAGALLLRFMPVHIAKCLLLAGVLSLAAIPASAQGPLYSGGGSPKAQCAGLVGTWTSPSATIELRKDGTTEVNGVAYR